MITRILDLVSQSLYDQVKIDRRANSRSYHLFTNPIGNPEGGQIKTFLQTNQIMAAQLPAPNMFLAKRINALFLYDGKPIHMGQTSLYGKTDIAFRIMGKTYWRGPAWLCASPFALFDVPKDQIPALKDNFGIEWERIGGSLIGDTVQFPGYVPSVPIDGIIIEWMADFDVEAHCYADSSEGLDLAIHIDGVLARPIQ